MKKFILLASVSIFISILSFSQNNYKEDAKMNKFISDLMSKMTLDEKIGQLNLVTPGGAVTGSVVSSDVDNKIRN
jgi:beta-glucosidase